MPVRNIPDLIVRKRILMGALFAVLYILLYRRGNNVFFYPGLIIIFAGEIIRLWASSLILKIEVLEREGIYSLTRNPLYFGSFIIGIGFIVLTISKENLLRALILLIFYSFLFYYIYYRTILNEEASLKEKFGPEFEEYRKNVPRFFFCKFPVSIGNCSLDRIIRNKELKTIIGILLIIAVLFIK